MKDPLDTFQELSDWTFLRAVELGCSPTPAGTDTVPMWRCNCPLFAHGRGYSGIITQGSLGLYLQLRLARLEAETK